MRWIITATIVTETQRECRNLAALRRAVENLLSLGASFHVEVLP